MGVLDYLLGWCALAAMIAPAAWAVRRIRRRRWPATAGAAGVLADVVAVVAWLQLVALALGTAGLLRVEWMVVACLLTGVAAGRLAGRGVSPPSGGRERPGAAVAVAAGLVAFGQTPPTISGLRGGVFDYDGLHYHQPMAARWVQEESVTGLHHIYPDALLAYYPGGAELLHAIGMLAFGDDLLSPLVNLVFVALILLAAWCLGDRRGAGAAAVTGAAALLATRAVAIDGGGTALNDMLMLAFVLAALALADRRALALAGAAAGLAVGVKALAVVPVAVLGAGVLVLARRRFGVFAAAALLTGGYWYARNLVAVGTPLPGTGLLGGPAGANTVGTSFAASGSAPALREALEASFGPLWAVWLVVAAAGLAIGVARRGDPWRRVAALGGAAALLAWPLLPYSSHAAFNLRYAFAGLALGAILLAIRCRARWAFVALALAGVLHVDPLHGSSRPAALAVAIAVTVLVATWPGRRAAAGLGLAGVAAGAALSGSFGASPLAYQGPAAEAVRPLAAWGRTLRGERIGVEGAQLQYQLYGADLSNHVQYVGRERADGGFARIADCAAWRRAVDEGNYGFLVLVPFGLLAGVAPEPSPHAAWTASDPAARLVLRFPRGVTVYAIDGPMDPAGC